VTCHVCQGSETFTNRLDDKSKHDLTSHNINSLVNGEIEYEVSYTVSYFSKQRALSTPRMEKTIVKEKIW